MLKNFIDSMRKKSLSLSELPDTIHVPGHAGKPSVDGLNLCVASIDDLAFAIQDLEGQLSEICNQLTALRKLHDLARKKGALGTDKVSDIFCREV